MLASEKYTRFFTALVIELAYWYFCIKLADK